MNHAGLEIAVRWLSGNQLRLVSFGNHINLEETANSGGGNIYIVHGRSLILLNFIGTT